MCYLTEKEYKYCSFRYETAQRYCRSDEAIRGIDGHT